MALLRFIPLQTAEQLIDNKRTLHLRSIVITWYIHPCNDRGKKESVQLLPRDVGTLNLRMIKTHYGDSQRRTLFCRTFIDRHVDHHIPVSCVNRKWHIGILVTDDDSPHRIKGDSADAPFPKGAQNLLRLKRDTAFRSESLHPAMEALNTQFVKNIAASGIIRGTMQPCKASVLLVVLIPRELVRG